MRWMAGLLLLALASCTGTGVKASCTRNPDGSVTCSIEAHRDGHPESR